MSIKRVLILVIPFQVVLLNSCSEGMADDFVLVKTGTVTNSGSRYYLKQPASDFYICTHEVTQKEWMDVMGTNPSTFRGDNFPVEMVSWYDCIEYCNKKSMTEGLRPFYNIYKNKIDSSNNNELDTLKWTVTINTDANGYRLPTEMEWEYAASGGHLSKNYKYSGSNNVDDVAWYWKNAGDKYLSGFWSWSTIEKNNNRTKHIALKEPNELGIYDMSGNVREWCWDKNDNNGSEPAGRIWKGGGWIGAEFCCEIMFRASLEATGKGPDQGFRVCRSNKYDR